MKAGRRVEVQGCRVLEGKAKRMINNGKQNDETGAEWEHIAGATTASKWERWRE